MTTIDPGARLVLTHGFVVNPRWTAFLASRPAPIITLGFDVFVQLVIAATTTEPWSSAAALSDSDSSTATATPPVSCGCVASPGLAAVAAGFVLRSPSIVSSACVNRSLDCLSGTRSCGRFGPARLGSTVERSSSMISS